ncbi:MAG: DNA (cytosine-5-)-methyltransferase, partial [Longimicrobiales bacterium]
MNGSDLASYRKHHRLSLTEMADLLDISKRHLIRMEKGEVPIRDTAGDALRYRELLAKQRARPDGEPAFRFIDLFAGIGGFRRGFEAVDGRCVFTSEWNRFAQKTYVANFPADHAIAGDITEVPTHAIPPHDVLLAGFPCQPFSIAGVSKKNALGRPHGFADETQGTLFFDIARILEVHRPRAFVLENVKNLMSHDRGRTFEVIMRVLEEDLGYHVSSRVIDARHWVPQHRERIFIIGFSERVEFDIERDIEVPEQETPRMHRILHPENGSEVVEEPYTVGPEARVGEKYTLSDRLWTYLQDYAEKHRRKGNGFGFGLVGPED